MTDYQRFIELYESIGIKLYSKKDGTHLSLFIGSTYIDNAKIGGYWSCYTVIRFDLEGKFLKQDFLE